jgi:hypothetical protein
MFQKASLFKIFVSCNVVKVTGMAQTVEQFASDWRVEGASSGEGVIFRACPLQPGGRPSDLHNGYRLAYRGVKRPGVALTTHRHLALRLNRD